MIRVYYWPREQRLLMQGHAEQKGLHNPVVCGSASALFYALCTTSNGFLKYRLIKGRYYKDQKGIGYCRMWPKRRYFKRTRVAIGTCVAGLMLLADKYPDMIQVDIATGIPFDDAQAMEEAEQGGVTYLRKFLYDIAKDRPLSPDAKADTLPRRRGRTGRKGHENGK